MKEMVISITPEGKIEHILKDSFFDTRFFGNRKIERMTTIEFNVEKQQFYIQWLKGPLTGHYAEDAAGRVLYFDTYDEAVQVEIERVNAMRLQGISFD